MAKIFDLSKAHTVKVKGVRMDEVIMKSYGQRYIDVESRLVIEAFYPEDRTAARSCLAEKDELIRNETFELEPEYL